jgi:hypothetical protein
MTMMKRLAAVGLLVCMASGLTLAQQDGGSDKPPDAPSTASTKPERTISSNPIELISGRSLFFPDIARTMGPLSPRQKFNLFVYNSTSGYAILTAAAGSGLGQARDSYDGAWQGASGYGKRVGASLATNASANLFGTFLLASALHQDPRFFVKENLDSGGTLKYAAWRLFNTRTDSGGTAINYSGLLGPLPAEGLANAYLPENQRTVGKTFQRYGIDLALKYGGNVFKQYWPTFFKRLRPILPSVMDPNHTNP